MNEKHNPDEILKDLLPELELRVTVSGQLRHTNDMRDS